MNRSAAKILVASASIEKRISIKSVLQGAGFTVKAADTRTVGVLRLLRATPNVLLLDRLDAEGEDVMARLAALRLELLVTKAKVILLSDIPPTQRDQEVAAEVSSLSFLVEPIEMGKLVDAIERALRPETKETAPRIGRRAFRTTTPPPTSYEKDWVEQERTRGRDRRPQGSLTHRSTSPPPRRYQEEVVGSKTPVPEKSPPQGSSRSEKKERSGNRSTSRSPKTAIYLPPPPSHLAETSHGERRVRGSATEGQSRLHKESNSDIAELEYTFTENSEDE